MSVLCGCLRPVMAQRTVAVGRMGLFWSPSLGEVSDVFWGFLGFATG